jgi:acyl-CoA dehydrogenase
MSAIHEALEWPFFDDDHRALHARLAESLADRASGFPAVLAPQASRDDVDAHCRDWVRALGQGGWLGLAVGGEAYGGASESLDTRTLCILRETLAAHDGLADFAFAMQGLGSGAITLDGSPELKRRYLPRVASGEAIAAFALSEPEAGSDVAAMSTTARRDGGHWVLDGQKTWISNGGIADFYVVFARQVEPGTAAEARGTKAIAAFVVDADAPGLRIAERLDTMAPHPLARLAFEGCRIPASHCLAEAGTGFKLAMRTLDVFRTSVAAAALGFARRGVGGRGIRRAK